jgi:hypothetical protein
MTQTIIHVPASEGGGAFDPTDIEITDNTSGAFLVKEGSNEYIRINTTNGSELTNITAGSTQGVYISGNSRTDLLTGSAASDTDLRIINSSGTQIFQVKGNHDTRLRAQNFIISDKASDTPYLQTDTNTNFTYTLDQSGANYFTVKNDVSANHCFRVNGNNRHTEIERIGYQGTQYIGYSGDYVQQTQPAYVYQVTEATGTSTLAVPDMNGSPGSGTFNNINKRTAIRIHSASQSASGDLFTATLNVNDAYNQLIREMTLYVSNYDSTNAFALKIQASAGSGNWRELNSSGITSVSGQTIDAATTYVYRIFQYAPGASTATRVYGINFMGKMAH